MNRTLKKLVRLGVVVLANIALGASLVQADEAAVDVDLTYRSLIDLTAEQRENIIPGNPNEEMQQQAVHYILVYDSLPTTGSVSRSLQSVQVLPRTGGNNSWVVAALGLGMLSLSGYLLYRHKKSGKYLVIAVLVVGGPTLVSNAEETVRHINDVVRLSATVGDRFTYLPEEMVDDYHYVGYIVEQDSPIATATETGSVLVHYQSEDGTLLKEDYLDTSEAVVGTAYDTAENLEEKPVVIAKEGKTYTFERVIGNEKGEVVAGMTEVTYLYKESIVNVIKNERLVLPTLPKRNSVVLRFRWANDKDTVLKEVEVLSDAKEGENYTLPSDFRQYDKEFNKMYLDKHAIRITADNLEQIAKTIFDAQVDTGESQSEIKEDIEFSLKDTPELYFSKDYISVMDANLVILQSFGGELLNGIRWNYSTQPPKKQESDSSEDEIKVVRVDGITYVDIWVAENIELETIHPV